MKTVKRLFLAFCLLAAFSSCDKLLPVDYDKAGRDLMALMQSNPALTIAEYRDSLKDMPGMSSKDMFTFLKADPSVYEFVQYLSLDMAQEKIKTTGVNVANLKRALEK
jgi:hypothetical protein